MTDSTAAGLYDTDPDTALQAATGPWLPAPDPDSEPGPLDGIWLSSYEYPSSGRGSMFTGRHYVVLVQRASVVTVRSTEGSYSRLKMDLTLNGQVLTGTWAETTNAEGYYRGATYHGAIQMLGEATARRFTGTWVGFSKDGDENTGPWTLDLVTRPATAQAIAEYSRILDEE
jgi:hypothetical protein